MTRSDSDTICSREHEISEAGTGCDEREDRMKQVQYNWYSNHKP